MTGVEPVFDHRQAAHCESGVISSLLSAGRAPLSEAMAFGIGAGITFAYLPFVKIGGLPLIAYRMPPRGIIRALSKRLGIPMVYETFRTPDEGMRALDAHIAARRPVGLQTSVFWLPYFPPAMRFHFNAHNLIVYGKTDEGYLVSDPVFEHPAVCDAVSLSRARFVRGAFAPKGLLYYPERVPENLPFERAIRDAIKFTTGMMLYTPLPIIGVRGIRTLARRVRALARRPSPGDRLFLGHIVRMQEEIGTGGAGFRFVYAAFLAEAAQVLNSPSLTDIAGQLTAVGDAWRDFALQAATMCKERAPLDPEALARSIGHCAELEHATFRNLRRAVA